jgi:hypothetical protein
MPLKTTRLQCQKQGQNLNTVPCIMFELFPTKKVTRGQVHIYHILRLWKSDLKYPLTVVVGGVIAWK